MSKAIKIFWWFLMFILGFFFLFILQKLATKKTWKSYRFRFFVQIKEILPKKSV